jgi:AraC family transcriptional regulator, transcriptional activator of pobA
LQSYLPFYATINEFLASISESLQSIDANFFCLKLTPENHAKIVEHKSPYKKDFYFLSLITNAGKTKIDFQGESITNLDNFLVIQAPGLPYSYYRDASVEGHVIYFKKSCLDFFLADFEKEFPFFDVLHTHFYRLNKVKFTKIVKVFEDVFEAYHSHDSNKDKLPAVKLLALLYELKSFTSDFQDWEQSFSTPNQLLYKKFLQLVNSHYLEKRTVEEYAKMLNVTSNHLSQVVKNTSNKKALSYINDRILAEAKSLIKFSTLDITEISFQLNFSDNANFGKFFKKNIGISPLEFRKNNPN